MRNFESGAAPAAAAFWANTSLTAGRPEWAAIARERKLSRLKRWIWIYFWLLIFEGVLRKWIFPGLSGPLLLVRDPVALVIYYQAYRCGKFSMRTMWPFALLSAAMVLLACLQVTVGTNTMPIALYGLRSYLLHLPLIFVIAGTWEETDIDKLGRWLLRLSVPMMLLVLAQFNSSRASWLNAGTGENSFQIAATGGHIRPAGPFSFGVGMQCLVVLTAAFVLDAPMRRRKYPPWLVGSAAFAVIGTVPLLGSRTVLFTLGALAIFTVLSGLSHGARLVGVSRILLLLLLAGAVAIQFPFFHSGLSVLQERWQQASDNEGKIQQVLNKRVVGVFQSGGEAAMVVPLLGKGLGLGSNFASSSIGGTMAFLAGENEWERVVIECGPVFGLLFMFARVGFGGYVVLQAYRALRRNRVLAWLLVPAVVPLMVITIMEQPTFLGFMVFGSGLCLAAARTAERVPAYLTYVSAPRVVRAGGVSGQPLPGEP